jgi:hypothetical protein
MVTNIGLIFHVKGMKIEHQIRILESMIREAQVGSKPNRKKAGHPCASVRVFRGDSFLVPAVRPACALGALW